MGVRLVGCLAIVAHLGACGSDSSPSTGGSVGAAEFSVQFAERWCAKVATCCQASGGLPADTCRAQLEQKQMEDKAAAEASGATFDSSAASACLARIADSTCDADVVAVRDLLQQCDVWLGTVAPGGACTKASQCNDTGQNTAVICGNSKCIVRVVVPAGGACATTDDCDALVAACDDATHTCALLPTEGQPCAKPCRMGFECGVDNLCHALGAVGAACASSSDCASDQCSGGHCASVLAGDHCELP